MDQNPAVKQANLLFKNGAPKDALDLLLQNDHCEACQSLLREYYLGEQKLEKATYLIDTMANKDSVEGLVAQSIRAFMEHALDAAINHAESAILQNQNSATAYNHLGRALQNAGLSGKAIKAFKSALRIDPEYAQAWHNLAHTRRALGILDDAVGHYEKAIECHPAYESAWLNLAITLSLLEKHQAASEAFNQLLSINDQHVMAWVNAGLAQHVLGHHQAALDCYERALKLEPNLALAHCYKGVLHNEMQQTSQAIKCLQQALKLDVNEIDAWCELTDVYEKLNDLPQAKKANQRALSIDPENPIAIIDGARILKRENHYQQALSLLDQVNEAHLPIRKATELCYERAEILDKMGQFELAFNSYQKANALATQSPRYQQFDQQAFAKRLQLIKQGLNHWQPLQAESWAKALFKKKPVIDVEDHLATGSRLCFLVGFPRSGTTLVDTILATNSKLQSVEEQPTIETVLARIHAQNQNQWDEGFEQNADWQALRTDYWQALKTHADLDQPSIIIDKLPMRFLETAFISRLFPAARFIFMKRHPGDVILSNFMQNYAPNSTFVHFNSLESTVKMYDQTMQLWYTLRQHLGQQLHEISYETLVKQPEKTTQALCQFLDIPFHQSMLATNHRLATRDRVSTNSYAQVAQEIHVKSVQRWKNYHSFFEPHLEVLQQHIKQLGY